jgi:formylglycine-generating enzyme required for sulfatase activity
LRWVALGGLAAFGFLTAYAAVALTRTPPAAVDSPPSLTTTEPEALSCHCCETPADGADPEAPSAQAVGSEGVAPTINERAAPGPAPEGMVWVPGGVYWRGSDARSHRDARPRHLIEVDGFWMDATAVTNAQFDRFVKASGYVTVAERTPTAQDFPGAPAGNLVAGSVVFTPPKGPVPLDNHFRWWRYVKGASWRHPEGPQSDLRGRAKHPVVQVAWEDAVAYARWAGKRLPTEAEFEFAARGGLDRKRYAWGDQLKPGGKWMANIWQGRFPYENTAEDGYRATAPVGSFPANGYGLHDTAGNVWEWCSDWYQQDYYSKLAAGQQPVRNPQGPDHSFDPSEPGTAKRVMRGGSYLCTDEYCTAYEAGARGKGAPDSGTNHVGFRCVMTKMTEPKAGT